MEKHSKITGLVRVVIFGFLSTLFVGCGGYREIRFEAGNSDSDSGGLSAVIHPGQSTRVTLVSGKKVEGETLWVRPDSMAISAPGNYGINVKALSALDIQILEVLEGGTKGGKALGAASLAIVGLVTLFLVGFRWG